MTNANQVCWRLIEVRELLKKIGVSNKIMVANGNEAVSLGALVGGCRFFAGYPITPSTGILYMMADALPRLQGKFYQPEDELAAIGMAISASTAGMKSMTATSGPGFSLMQEELGWAIINEIPLVVVNAMRVGPSTGQPTKFASADINCLIKGRHGDGGDCVIVLSPNSIQECFDMTIQSFNLTEKYRSPVFIAMDGFLCSLSEKLEIPENTWLCDRTTNRRETPFGVNGGVSNFVAIGEDEGITYAGLIHNQFGKRSSFDPIDCDKHLRHLVRKRKSFENDSCWSIYCGKDCDLLMVGYGLAGRAMDEASRELCKLGHKVGYLNLKMIWPINMLALAELERAKKIAVVENNAGQYVGFLRQYLPTKTLISFNKWQGEPIETGELIAFCKKIIGASDENLDSCVSANQQIRSQEIREHENPDPCHSRGDGNLNQSVKIKNKFPFCPGCGHNAFCSAFLSVLEKEEIKTDDIILTSGIGCGGILATTLDADVIKTSHGRALNAARAIRLVRPEKMVITISGDGDLVNIGGNALIHTAREKKRFPILCICLDNANYGMTGGQVSATTPKSSKTSVPLSQSPFDLKKLLYDGCQIDFFARSSTLSPNHLKQSIGQAINFIRNQKSFAFIQVFSPCVTYFAKMNPDQFSKTHLQECCGIWERPNEN